MFVSSRSGIKRYKQIHTLSKVGDPDIISIYVNIHVWWWNPYFARLYRIAIAVMSFIQGPWALVFHHDCLAGGCDQPVVVVVVVVVVLLLLLLFISYRKKTHNLIIQLQDVTGNSAPNRSVLGYFRDGLLCFAYHSIANQCGFTGCWSHCIQLMNLAPSVSI